MSDVVHYTVAIRERTETESEVTYETKSEVTYISSDGEVRAALVDIRPINYEPRELSQVQRELEVQPTRSRSDGWYVAEISGRWFNPGRWNRIRNATEAQLHQLHGNEFMEMVKPGAFNKAIEYARRAARGPALLYGHGKEYEGKKPIGKITRMDGDGNYKALLFDVSYVNELLPALRAGDFGMSYAPAHVVKGRITKRPGKSDHNPSGLPEIVLHEVPRLREISVVTWPADPDTTIAVRDLRQPAALAAA